MLVSFSLDFMNIERIKKYDIFFAGLCDEKSPIIDFPVMVGSIKWFLFCSYPLQLLKIVLNI